MFGCPAFGIWLGYPDADVSRPLLVMERNVKTTVKNVEKVMKWRDVRASGVRDRGV